MAGEEPARPGQEPGAGRGLLVGQDLGVGQPGVVVDGDMDEVIANTMAVPGVGSSAVQPPAAPLRDAAQLLDVDVDQLPGLVTLIAVGAAAGGAQPGAGDGVQVTQQRDLMAGQDPPDR